MLEKILSVLPYNPSLVHQLAFYGKRLRQESAIRRTGLVFIVLAFLVQFFAVLSPPQPTLAYSTNDMIDGGIANQAEAVTNCRHNLKSYGTVLANFGINCDDVARAGVVNSLSSTSHGNDLYSMGWLTYGQTNPKSHKPTKEVTLDLVGVSSPLYGRLLSSFDTYDHSSYKALQVTSSLTHKTYFILFSCGNLVSVHPPSPRQRCQYNQDLYADDKKCFPPCKYNNSISGGNAKCFKPCKYKTGIADTSPLCKPCDKASSSQDVLACVALHKTAANITTNTPDANNTTAQPKDVITYTLYAQNEGQATIKQFVFRESLSDVLDYANVQDLHGGTIDANGLATWPAVTIKSGASAQVQVTVAVKDSVPQTPVDPGDGGHFDLVMTNVYGNSVNINLPGSPAKAIETAAATLPNTGPGSSLLISAFIVMVAGYFYARNRLLSREVTVAIHDNAQSGGI